MAASTDAPLKPFSAQTSIRTLSHGTRQDSLLSAVRTLHDTPDQEDGPASAGVGAHAAAVVAAAMTGAPDGGLQSSHGLRAARRPYDAHRLKASLQSALASTAASAQAASAHASALSESEAYVPFCDDGAAPRDIPDLAILSSP